MKAREATTSPAPSAWRRVFVATFLGVLLMQVAWVVTVPAFGGMDEFDHALRADAVARGELVDGGPTAHGRGGQVVVAPDLARAASRMCASYDYTGHDNCYPVRHNADGTVVIDSAASGYNPAYYAIAGIVARPFSGATTDVVGRLATAVMAAGLLAWAVVVTRRRTRSAWPSLALMVVTTPTLVYSSAVTSPNGVGYAAGALVWSAALWGSLAEEPPPLAAFAVGATALLVTHSTNVTWLVVTLAAVLLLRPRAEWATWLRDHRRGAVATAAAVGAVALACLAWIVVQKTDWVRPDDSVHRHYFPTVPGMVGQWVVWCLQTIGAFPSRGDPAPLLAYAMWLLPFVALMVLGWRAGSRRVRLAMVLVVATWLVVPTVATFHTYHLIGFAWQGRYALPLAAGLPVLAAYSLVSRGREPRRATVLGTFAVCTLAQALCVTTLAAHPHRAHFAPTVVPGLPGAALACVLALAGGALFSYGLARGQVPRPTQLTATVPAPVLAASTRQRTPVGA